MNIVIIGHVDHGKSTLVGRMLYDTGSIPEALVEDVRAISKELGKEMEFAYLLDSLEEERQQNITIDTTQTFFSSEKRDYVIIDAPGHREFLKNMITGASMAQVAVLIVDVNIGMQEQTKRHAYLANLLGLEHLIVVLNKMDSAGYANAQFEKTRSEVLVFLQQFGITLRNVIPISAKDGDNVARRSSNMPWYSGAALVEALDALTASVSEDSKNLRFPIQDRYLVDGKTIYVGRVENGSVRNGEKVFVAPANQPYTVNSIEVWNSKKELALTGDSIGLTFKEPLDLLRGEVICSGSMPRTTDRFDATVFWLSTNAVTLKEELLLKLATKEIPCVLEKIKTKIDSSSLNVLGSDCNDLRETEVGQVVIRAKGPVVIEDFNHVEGLGRFVLVRSDQIDGGGIIQNAEQQH